MFVGEISVMSELSLLPAENEPQRASDIKAQIADQSVSLTNATSVFNTNENKQFYRENGYLVLRNVVSPEQLANLQVRVFEEFKNQKSSGSLIAGGGTLAGHVNCFPGEDARQIYAELVEKGVIGLVKELFPQAERLPNVGCNLNLPGSVAQHYHTDSSFTGEFIICNIGVVDTDLANGAIDVLPGTHKRFYKFWQYALQRLYKRTTRVPLTGFGQTLLAGCAKEPLSPPPFRIRLTALCVHFMVIKVIKKNLVISKLV
jgi:hypothetical protein